MIVKYDIPVEYSYTEGCKKLVSLSPKAVGMQIFDWTIISDEVVRYEHHNHKIHVQCKCGLKSLLSLHSLRFGKSKSCTSCSLRKHPQISKATRDSLGGRYRSMKSRCTDPKNVDYHSYGGRGIKCLFESVDSYIDCILDEIPHNTYKGLEIDRVDNDGHYEHGNLRLVTKSVNNRNKQDSVMVDYFGETVPAFDVVERLLEDYPEVKYAELTIYGLLGKGLTSEQILKRWQVGGKARKPRLVDFQDEVYTLAEFERLLHECFDKVLSNESLRVRVAKKGLTGDQIYEQHQKLNP